MPGGEPEGEAKKAKVESASPEKTGGENKAAIESKVPEKSKPAEKPVEGLSVLGNYSDSDED